MSTLETELLPTSNSLTAEESPVRHILVVDDEYEVRQMLVDLLEYEGFRVDGATDGQEALSLLAHTSYDLLLSDLHMPNVDGLELIQTLREVQPGLPVIIITGYPSLRKVIEVMKSGAVDFLPKPFDADTVIHVVKRTLKESDLVQENQRLQAEVNKKSIIEKLNRELHSKVRELTKLNTISERLSIILDTEQLFEQVVGLAAELTSSERVSLMLLDRRRQVLRIRAARGLSPEVVRQTVVPLGDGVCGTVAKTHKLIRVNGRMAPGTENRYVDDSRYFSNSWMSVPLLIGHQVFGVLNVSERRSGLSYDDEDERILLTLAEKAANKVENNALYETLYDNLIDTLHSLVTTIEARDPYTHRHSQRVTDIAVAMGMHMELGAEDIESLRFVTVLHDIGKIGVRDSILTKNNALDAREDEKIKLHTLIGSKIVEPLGLTPNEHGIVRNHHERFDGSGYPDGLKGTDIPLLARIVSVADAFDAMTSTRSYRQALSLEQAFNELRRGVDTQFQAELVHVLISGVESNRINVSPPEERLPEAPLEFIF